MIRINKEWCKGCNICIQICPVNALKESEKINRRGIHLPELKNDDLCIKCGLCELHCPDMAIFVIKDQEKNSSEQVKS